jgi:hypothetical protein
MAAQTKATKEKPASRRASATTATGRGGRSATSETTREDEHGAALPVPVVTPHVKVMRVPVGRGAAAYLPPPDRLAFYGGLAAAAAIGILDWPVAAAVGLGTMVARRAAARRESARPVPTARPEGAEERETPSRPASTTRTRAATGTSRSRATTGTSRARTATGTRAETESGTAADSGAAGRSTGRTSV